MVSPTTGPRPARRVYGSVPVSWSGSVAPRTPATALLPMWAVLTRLVGAGFRRAAAYRVAVLAGATTNTVFGIVKLAILLAAARSAGGTLGGYDRAELSTYAWLTQGLLAVVALLGGTSVRVDLRIRTGDVAIDLARPVDPVLAWLADDAGRALQAGTFRFLAPFVFGSLVFGIAVPKRAATVPLFLVSVALAWLVSFACRVMVDMAAFWTTDVRGLTASYVALSNVLGGVIVPLSVLPAAAADVARLRPFSPPSGRSVGRRSCSPPTTCPTSSASPTGCWWSTPDGSPSTAPGPSSPPRSGPGARSWWSWPGRPPRWRPSPAPRWPRAVTTGSARS